MEYSSAISTLLENLDKSISTLETTLVEETGLNASEYAYYMQMMVQLCKFSKLGHQNYILSGQDFRKVRICMLLNQYVFGDQSTADAVALARSTTNEATLAVLTCIHQLKADLVGLKACMVGVDEFESFATNMAVIKVNRVLTAETKSLQRTPVLFQYFDMVLDSPSDTNLASTHLAAKSQKDRKWGKFGKQQGSLGLVNSTLPPCQSPHSGINVSSASSSDRAKHLPNTATLEQVLVKVVRCRQAMRHFERVVTQMGVHAQECGLLWWQVLGNNQYDYAVTCYVEKLEGHIGQIKVLAAHLGASAQRWCRLERTLRMCLYKRKIRVRLFGAGPVEDARNQVHNLISQYLQDDLDTIIRLMVAVAQVGAGLLRGNDMYRDIVAEYMACIDFSVGLMAHCER